ncbi:MAG: SURF1 family protein [Micrococcus sp.]|nr:SURF1 family protein [Micrococcus sp.]
MLKTALKPFWLLMLLLALGVASAFVWLSMWQFESAETMAPPPRSQTETPVALESHFAPVTAMTAQDADQVVEFSGEFVAGSDVLVAHRQFHGRDGYWVVSAVRVADSPDGEVMPVVRGWTAEPSITGSAPVGEVSVVGRLLPPEGPVPRETNDAGTGLLFGSLSPAQLVNVWDEPAYAGFVAAFSVTDAAGQDVGAGSGTSAPGLEAIWVAPQPEETSIVWMNVFYGVEWIVFAGFALFLWFRFMKDDHLREQRELALDREWEEQWRAEELQRRRAAAARAKNNARAAYTAYLAQQGGGAVATDDTRPGADAGDAIRPGADAGDGATRPRSA